VRRIWNHAIHPDLKVGAFGHKFVKEMNMSRKVRGSVLVVGGGIAGMQSALDLANSGYSVYLLEKGPSIGGAMAQLDKTFPTNDCSI
jgi:heterodisulfide reductase subunit A-like polyferredoxin